MRPAGLNKERWIIFAILFILSMAVFYFQPPEVLFGSGHIGWVSSHTLAIIRNATPERWFLGFTCDFTGTNNFAYFDRYPVVFSGTMHLLLEPFKETVSEYIRWARTYMNVIYVLSMLAGYKIAYIFTRDRVVALMATMFTFMGVFFVFYKDMVHFDQPAVLGLLLLFYAIARYELYHDSRWIWPAATVVLLGRGYASNFLLLLWNLIFVASLIKNSNFKLSAYVTSAPFGVFVLAGLLSFTALSFNVLSEADIRNVALQETSIIESAQSRLDWDFEANFEQQSNSPRKTDFIPFTEEQLKRTIGGLVPYALYPYQGEDSPEPRWELLSIYFLSILFLCLLSLTRTDLLELLRTRKRLTLLGLFGGFFWLYPMKSLAAFHNYTHMYNAVFYLLAFSAVFYCVKSTKIKWGILASGVLLFTLSHSNLHDARITYNAAENRINDDIDRIRTYLEDNDIDNVYVATGHRSLVEGSPYAACFYLSGRKIADDPSEAAVILSRQPLAKEMLVPNLVYLNLYRSNN